MAGLPELNTGGVDITNTIAKIASMRHQDMLNKNMQSEMQYRQANEQRQNTLAVYQANKEKAETKEKNMDLIGQSLGFLEGLSPEEQKVKGPDFIKTMSNMFQSTDGAEGMNPAVLPNPDYFWKEGNDKDGNPSKVWDSTLFNSWVRTGRDAILKVKNPTVGSKSIILHNNPNYGKVQGAQPFLASTVVTDRDLKPVIVETHEYIPESQAKESTPSAKREQARKEQDTNLKVHKEDRESKQVFSATGVDSAGNKYSKTKQGTWVNSEGKPATAEQVKDIKSNLGRDKKDSSLKDVLAPKEKKASTSTPPAGYTDSGKTGSTKDGRKGRIFLSPDGKKAWIQP